MYLDLLWVLLSLAVDTGGSGERPVSLDQLTTTNTSNCKKILYKIVMVHVVKGHQSSTVRG